MTRELKQPLTGQITDCMTLKVGDKLWRLMGDGAVEGPFVVTKAAYTYVSPYLPVPELAINVTDYGHAFASDWNMHPDQSSSKNRTFRSKEDAEKAREELI